MRKLLSWFVMMGLVLSLGQSIAQAQTGFKDVPEGHWAESAIRVVTQTGALQGYPDGTFRGSKTVTRYEVAILAARLFRAIRSGTPAASGGVDQKVIAELRQEIEELRQSVKVGAAPGAWNVSGEYTAQARGGNLAAKGDGTRGKGPRADYRFKLSAANNGGDGSWLRVNLDTMDLGYNQSAATGSADLARQYLDLETGTQVEFYGQPILVKATAGPGPQIHATDSLFPQQAGYVYLRPRTSGSLTSAWWGDKFTLSGKFTARGANNDTGPTVKEYSAWAGWDLADRLGWSPYLSAMVDLYSTTGVGSGTKDIRGRLDLALQPMEKVELMAAIAYADGSTGTTTESSKSLYSSGVLHLKDKWNTGSDIWFSAHRVGSQYLDGTTGTAGNLTQVVTDAKGDDLLTATGKYLQEGSMNLSAVWDQTVNDRWSLKGIADVNATGNFKYGDNETISNMTLVGGVSYQVNPAATIDASWTFFQDKTRANADENSDIARVGLLYSF